MDITIAGSTLARAFNADQLNRVTIELAAFDGEVGSGAVALDDPSAADDYKGSRQFRVDEIDTLLVDGFIGDQDRTRGPVPITNREVVYSVRDPNALLFAKRAVRTRPVETDVARVLAFANLDLSSVDTTWVLNTFTSSMPSKRYDGEGWAELITDVVELTGKTLFIHDKASGGRCLHYHRLTAGHTCGLSISDAVTTNGPTVWIPGNPQKKTSPADLGNDILFIDQENRTATYTDATSITNHDADGLAHQKVIRVDAKSQTQLDAIAASQGAETKDERFTWVCTIGPLDATALALIRVGDLITTTSQVMGLSAAEKRIAHMTLSPSRGEDGNAVPGLWDATLELGAPIRRPFGAGGGKGRSLPKLPPGVVTSTPYILGNCPASSLSITLLASVSHNAIDESTKTINFITVAVTDFMVVLVTTHGVGGIGVSSPSGLTPHPSNGMAVGSAQVHMFHKRGVGSSENITIDFSANTKYDITIRAVTEANYEAAASGSGTGTAIDFGPITGEYGEHVALVGGAVVGTPGITITPDTGTDVITEGNSLDGTITLAEGRLIHTWPGEWQASHEIQGTMSGSATWAALTLAFSGESCIPMDGSPAYNEEVGTGDGVTVTFFTATPYAPGSLVAKVDGIDVSLDLSATDPTNRSFTLSFAPSASGIGAPAETVTADYIVAI